MWEEPGGMQKNERVKICKMSAEGGFLPWELLMEYDGIWKSQSVLVIYSSFVCDALHSLSWPGDIKDE